MKRNEKGFRELVKLAMRYKARTDTSNETSKCLVCEYESGIGSMYMHMEKHIVNDEITAKDFRFEGGE